MNRKTLLSLVLAISVLGVISIGSGQQVVTTTTTTVITQPGTTYTTVISEPGTTLIETLVKGGYRIIYAEARPDQECVLVVEATPVTVVTIPGMTINPTTIMYTIPATTYETTMTKVEGGSTVTTTGGTVLTKVLTTSIGPVTTEFTMPIPVSGKIVEYCKVITVTLVYRYDASQEIVATITAPGYTFEGTVMTYPTVFLTEPVTETITTTRPGTTYTETYEEKPETIVTTITKPGTTKTETIVSPGSTVTKTITYTTTLSESTTAATTQATTTTQIKPTTTQTTQTSTTTEQAGFPITYVVIGVVVIVIAAAAAALLMRKR